MTVDNDTPLLYSIFPIIYNNDYKIFKFLLESGANPYHQGRHGNILASQINGLSSQAFESVSKNL